MSKFLENQITRKETTMCKLNINSIRLAAKAVVTMLGVAALLLSSQTVKAQGCSAGSVTFCDQASGSAAIGLRNAAGQPLPQIFVSGLGNAGLAHIGDVVTVAFVRISIGAGTTDCGITNGDVYL